MTSDLGRPFQAELATGREGAFAELYDGFAERLYRVALAITQSANDAEDAVHDTFLSIWTSRRNLTGVDDLDAYLFVSLRRAAGRIAKRQRSQRWAIATLPSKPELQRRSEQDESLQRAINCLPEVQREILALKIDGELTFAQIAGVLGINANTAASRYRLALESLRQKLKHD